jgi:hypothetical protein
VTDVIVEVLERVAKTYRVKDGVWIDMSKPSITEAGKWLLDKTRWDEGMRGFFTRVFQLGSPQDMATIVGMIEKQAATAERQRLLAEHATWDGHTTAGFLCGVCTRLLAEPSNG